MYSFIFWTFCLLEAIFTSFICTHVPTKRINTQPNNLTEIHKYTVRQWHRNTNTSTITNTSTNANTNTIAIANTHNGTENNDKYTMAQRRDDPVKETKMLHYQWIIKKAQNTHTNTHKHTETRNHTK